MSEERGEYIVDGPGAEWEPVGHDTVTNAIVKLIDRSLHSLVDATRPEIDRRGRPYLPPCPPPRGRAPAGQDHGGRQRRRDRAVVGRGRDPGWMRLALALFQEAEGRFDRARIISEADVLEEVITVKCGFD